MKVELGSYEERYLSEEELFNPKTIKRLCGDIKITSQQKKAAQNWLQLLESEKLKKEKGHYLDFAVIILKDILGYPIQSTEGMSHEKGNVEFVISNNEGKQLLCIEAKGTDTKDLFAPQHRTKKEHETPIKQTWDYMGSMGLEYGICTNYKEFVLITKQLGYSKYHFFDFASIKKNEKKLQEFIGIFSKERIIDKGFVEKLHKESVVEEREFTKEFYKLFHETRLMMIKAFQEKDNVSRNEAIYYTQIFLNRLIFVFFVEDKGFIPDKQLFSDRILHLLNSAQFTEHTKKIFDDIKELFIAFDKGSRVLSIFGFNGSLFSGVMPEKIYFSDIRDREFFSDVRQYSKLPKSAQLNEKATQIISKHPDLNPIISNLLIMDSFDFNTEVNVNILGHIFEQSISDLEELKQEGVSRRKQEGVYYTPEYVTDYICRNTIIPYLSKSGTSSISELLKEYENDVEELEQKFREIKILDPACGSGAFLVKSIDILLELHKAIQTQKNIENSYSGDQLQITHEWDENKEIRAIIENNIYGIDINHESIEITKLSLFLRLAANERKLIGLSQNIKVGNSLVDDKKFDDRAFVWQDEFPEILGTLIEDKGFDVIVGNPPYGAKFTETEQKYLKEKYNIGTSDSAQLMIMQAKALLKKNGYHGFIVPKSLTYASNWKNIRYLLLEDLIILLDVGKVWKDVKLEQVIFTTNERTKDSFYLTGSRHEELLNTEAKIPKKLCLHFDLILNGITDDDLKLGRKIYENSTKLGDKISNTRGGMIQKSIKNKGSMPAIGGQQVQRNAIVGQKGFVDKITDDSAKVQNSSCLVQNIVAHIANPIDYVKITATVPTDTNFVILDTVNQITSDQLSPYFIASLLNSKLINWYAYRFIFAKAVRTMHFDTPVTNKIPLVIKNEKKIEQLTKKLIETTEELNTLNFHFVENIKRTFNIESISGLTKILYELSFNEFLKKLYKKTPKKLTPEKEDEYFDYFEKKKHDAKKLNKSISNLTEKIDYEIYQIFDLTDKEIALVESSMP